MKAVRLSVPAGQSSLWAKQDELQWVGGETILMLSVFLPAELSNPAGAC